MYRLQEFMDEFQVCWDCRHIVRLKIDTTNIDLTHCPNCNKKYITLRELFIEIKQRTQQNNPSVSKN